MPILENIDFSIDIDAVLKAQGADPLIIKKRSPTLVDIAEKAIEIGRPLLEPKILYQELSIEKVSHEKISLSNGSFFKGKLITQHLSSANTVFAILCSIGDKVEKTSSETISADPVLGLALEGVGSAATEALANAACNYFDQQAEKKNLKTTIPLSPGMVGWSVEEGQSQIFGILDPSEIGVQLTSSFLMLPRKTLSMVIGFGKDLENHGDICSYCSMNENCQYKTHYSKNSEII